MHRVVDRAVRVREHVVRIVVRLRRQARELVAAEERVVVGPLVVDAADRHVLACSSVLRSKNDWPHVVGRLRQLRGQRQRRRRELRRRHRCADKRRAQRDRPAGVARRRGDRREIAREHRRGRHELEEAGRRHVHAGALVAAEEEQLAAARSVRRACRRTGRAAARRPGACRRDRSPRTHWSRSAGDRA